MRFQARAFAATYLRPASIDCLGMPLGPALDLEPELYKPADGLSGRPGRRPGGRAQALRPLLISGFAGFFNILAHQTGLEWDHDRLIVIEIDPTVAVVDTFDVRHKRWIDEYRIAAAVGEFRELH
jgi:hypothetical protein